MVPCVRRRLLLLAARLALGEPHLERELAGEDESRARTERDIGVGPASTAAFESFAENLLGGEELEQSFAVVAVDAQAFAGSRELVVAGLDDLRGGGDQSVQSEKQITPEKKRTFWVLLPRKTSIA